VIVALGDPIHDITTDADRARDAAASQQAVTVSPDLRQEMLRAIETLVSAAGWLLGQSRPQKSPVVHVDPRLPSRSWHIAAPRPAS
jgi:hypothetical protein